VLLAVVTSAFVAVPGTARAEHELSNDGTVVRDILPDAGRSRLFVSAGHGSTSIRVVGYDGTLLGTIPNQQGASGLALSADGTTLYAALADADAISMIDTTTLVELRRVTVPRCPDELTLAGSRLWFTHGCTSSGRALFSMGLGVSADITGPDVGWSVGGVRLVSTGPHSSTIYASADHPDPVIRRIEVTGGAASISSEKLGLDLVHTAYDIDIDTSGSTVYLGGPVFAAAVSAATLEITRIYPTPDQRGAFALALSPDGRHLGVATRYRYGPSFLLYPLDSATPTHDRYFPNGGYAGEALAFSPDGDRAFFGSHEAFGDSGELLSATGLATEPLTVSAAVEPITPARARIHGRLRSTDGSAVSARTVEVTVSTAAGTTTVASVATGEDGTYAVVDASPPAGPGTYRVHWAGDSVRPAALAVVAWHPERPDPVASLAPPTSLRDPEQEVDLPRVTATAVDEAHGRLYLAGGTGTTSLAVHDSDGRPVAAIGGLAGPHGLALSEDQTTLYVSERDGRSVAVVDTAALRIVGRWTTSAMATYPEHLSTAGGRLWISANHGSSDDLVAEIDTAQPWEVREEQDTAGMFTANPFTVASPVDPLSLYVGNLMMSTAYVARLDIGARPPAMVAQAPDATASGRGGLDQIVASRDGRHVFVAATDFREHDARTLALVRSYRIPSKAVAAAETADSSHLAAGLHAPTGDDVLTWAHGSDAPIVAFELDGVLEPRSLGFSADASRLFAVSRDGTRVVLHVLPRPLDPTSCTTDLHAGEGTAGSPMQLSGTVVDSLGAPAEGATVVLRRTDPLGQVSERGRTTTDAQGRYSFEDSPAIAGRHRYEAEAKAYGRSPTCSAGTTVEVSAASTTTTTTTTTMPATTTTTTTTTMPATTTTTRPSTPTSPTTQPSTTTTGPPPAPPRPRASGYWMLDAAGRVHRFGDSRWMGDAVPTGEAVDIEPTPSGNGYWILDSAGRVSAFGDARHLGGAAGLAPAERPVSLSAHPAGAGYWIFTDRGRVFALGSAGGHGDLGGMRLNGPVLDSVATPSGRGYYMVAEDGGIFAFGDARFHGSMGGSRLNAPVQSLVPDPDGAGYWLVAGDGGIFSFAAPFFGSMGSSRLNKPVTGMVGSRGGYLMVAEDGGIFAFGDAPFHGSLGDRPPASRITSVAAIP
jgi:sugar lactone lactonase YvrE